MRPCFLVLSGEREAYKGRRLRDGNDVREAVRGGDPVPVGRLGHPGVL